MRNRAAGWCRGESEKKRANTRKTIWLRRLMDASPALSLFFICFPLSLLISPPPPRLSFSKPADGINQSRSLGTSCGRADEPPATSSPVRRAVMMMICFSGTLFFFQGWHRWGGGEWCWWRPPCCCSSSSSLNQTQSINKITWFEVAEGNWLFRGTVFPRWWWWGRHNH